MLRRISKKRWKEEQQTRNGRLHRGNGRLRLTRRGNLFYLFIKLVVFYVFSNTKFISVFSESGETKEDRKKEKKNEKHEVFQPKKPLVVFIESSEDDFIVKFVYSYNFII